MHVSGLEESKRVEIYPHRKAVSLSGGLCPTAGVRKEIRPPRAGGPSVDIVAAGCLQTTKPYLWQVSS